MGTRIGGGAGYSTVDCDRTSQEAVFEREACGCRPCGHAELRVDGTRVGVYGATADEGLLGQLRIVGPPGHEPEHFDFPLGQPAHLPYQLWSGGMSSGLLLATSRGRIGPPRIALARFAAAFAAGSAGLDFGAGWDHIVTPGPGVTGPTHVPADCRRQGRDQGPHNA